MGTVVSFDVPDWAGQVLGRAVQWLHWVDATFSPYRDDSDVSRFGRGELRLADCAPELAEVLDACAAVTALSGGYFTVTPGGRFDPSGYVKGWAIERAAATLTAAGSAEHSVNGGGDVQCVGDRGPGQPWRVGVADPLRPGSLALVVAGQDFAVATSGRPGPVLLDVPEDVCHGEHDFAAEDFAIDPTTLRAPSRRTRPDRADTARAAALIARAKRPLILAGGGIHLSQGYQALLALAEAQSIPVAHTMSGKGAAPLVVN